MFAKPRLIATNTLNYELNREVPELLADDSPMWQRMQPDGSLRIIVQGEHKYYTLILPPACVQGLRMTLTNT